MNADRFDVILAALTAAPSRRATLRALAGLGLAGLVSQTDAKKKHRKKKKCAKAGQRPGKKRKRCCAGLAPDGSGVCRNPTSSPPSPPPGGCTPTTCPPGACGGLPDGCGGTLNCGGCPANQICLRNNVCQPCTIICTGTPTQCGVDVQQALQAGGTFYVCPGRYQSQDPGGFTPASDAVTLIGAGEGADPASNTILDAAFLDRVLTIPLGMGPVTLERLRIAAGHAASGGGIFHAGGTTLRLTECSVIGNISEGGDGAGIFVDSVSSLEMTRCTVAVNITPADPFGDDVGGGIWTAGATTLTDCVIEGNTAAAGGGLYVDAGATTLAGTTQVRGNTATINGGQWGGGGIFVNTDISSNATLAIAESCLVTGNSAALNRGGGIRGSTNVTLAGADPSPIVVNNCHENCAGVVPKCATMPVSC